jgi:hypothetical protein
MSKEEKLPKSTAFIRDLKSLENRIIVANRSKSSVRSYCRALQRLHDFHKVLPSTLQIDQVIDFLVYLQEDQKLNWRTIKLYVAGLRYYYQEIVGDVDIAHQIPYPKEKPRFIFSMVKDKLYNRDWVVYAKETFGGPEQVMEYLGRYTHKIAIANHRIIKVSNTHVYFKYLNRDKNKTEIQKVTGEKFIKLFLQHVLPKRFIKIRHYEFLSTRSKQVDLSKISAALKVSQVKQKQDLTTR